MFFKSFLTFFLVLICGSCNGGEVKENFLVPTFSKEILTGSIGCVNNVLSLTPRFVEQVKQCLPGLSDSYGTKSGQKPPNCSWFCQAHACNFLGMDNLPNNEMYNTFIDLSVPESFRDRVKAQVKGCVDKFGKGVGVASDTCEGAGTFNNCIFEIFAWPC